ncbi:MAG: hypothetical protein ABFS35_23305 [Bacteroidota bacterium]
MMPPICCICNKDLKPDEGGLIYFIEDTDDIITNERLSQPGFEGHPSNAFWFCEKHYPAAKELSHLTKKEAFIILEDKKLI